MACLSVEELHIDTTVPTRWVVKEHQDDKRLALNHVYYNKPHVSTTYRTTTIDPPGFADSPTAAYNGHRHSQGN